MLYFVVVIKTSNCKVKQNKAGANLNYFKSSEIWFYKVGVFAFFQNDIIDVEKQCLKSPQFKTSQSLCQYSTN